MRKMLFATAALVTIVGPAVAADMPLQAAAPFAARFSWTSCYLGGHLGGGFAHKDMTDPVLLVQDSFLGAGSTNGITTVSPAPTGVVIGGQIGCDYQFASSWVIGVEGAASGSTMQNTRTVGLPLGFALEGSYLPPITVDRARPAQHRQPGRTPARSA